MAAEPGAEGAGLGWTASLNGTGLRVEKAGSGAQTVVFSPNPLIIWAPFIQGVDAA